MKISAVILAKNEEGNIEKAINSLSFCDEILVIDDYSGDETGVVAKKAGAVVYMRELGENFSDQRNYGLEKAKNEWVLFIDADEIVSKELSQEIVKLKNLEVNAYYIKRRDFWWGRELKYGEVKAIRVKGLIRLVKKSSGKWISPVHETFKTSGSVKRLNSYIDHYPHQTLKKFLQEINFYSTLRARELQDDKKEGSILSIICLPPFKFIYTYFLKGGFLDGPAGFAYSFLMSFHSFLVRAKLYQYTKLQGESK